MKTRASAKTPEARKKTFFSPIPKTASSQPKSPANDPIRQLQGTMGNQAVRRLFRSGVLQAKLKTGRPKDNYELEADMMAKQAMRTSEPDRKPKPPRPLPGGPSRGEAKAVRTTPLAEHITPFVQQRETGEEPLFAQSTQRARDDLQSRLSPGRGGGQALPETERSFMEKRFGVDFSGVRVHADSDAVRMNRELNAKAFTHGENIYLGTGGYSPAASTGRSLMAHELTHVVQQRRNGDGADIIQRRRRRRRGVRRRARSPVPGMRRTLLSRFFSDLNTVIKTAFNKTTRLTSSHFLFKTPVQLLADVKTSAPATYSDAYSEARKFCTQPLSQYCGKNVSCRQTVRTARSRPTLCGPSGTPTKLLAAQFLPRGLRPPRGGALRIKLGQSRNEILETVIHEGLHKERGKIWGQRSKKIGATHYYHYKTRALLSQIKESLDEGATQILTKIAIGNMQKLRNRSWFKSYSATGYAKEVRYVENVLKRHGKSKRFLIKAYFSDSSKHEVEDLQLWQ